MKKFPKNKKDWAVRKRAFRIWQKTPYQVAPLSEEQHTCQSCGTVFQGNFCPRCGQSARVSRFSFKTAFFLFLDIWGMGNRGMFRSIRDLMLRPGYMIRDYVRGCQSAYFPPFKMFFILATFSLLVSHGFSLSVDQEKHDEAEIEPGKEIVINGKKIDNKVARFVTQVPRYMVAMEKKNPSLFSFSMLILISSPLYLFFRKSPNVPDLRFSEHIVALVYTSNMYTLYRMLADLMPLGLLSSLLKIVAIIMIFVSLKQFTGFSKRRLLGYMALTFLFFFLTLVIIVSLILAILYKFS